MTEEIDVSGKVAGRKTRITALERKANLLTMESDRIKLLGDIFAYLP